MNWSPFILLIPISQSKFAMLLTGFNFELFDQYGADWKTLSGALSTSKKRDQLPNWTRGFLKEF